MKRRQSPGAFAIFSVIATGLCVDAISAATPSVARQSIDRQDLRRHVSFLASDTLEGRAAGTRGGRAAASYLAGEFRRLGLTPSGDSGDYLQEFDAGYRNVLGLLPGSDPETGDEVILLGGHFDHVGFGSEKNSFGPFGQIHNGADDNASGVAAILEVAEAFSRLDVRPRRTMLFALWDAEEAGLLGSEHWIRHPTLPLSRVKLVINVDMIGRLRNDHVTVYGARTAANLRRLASRANGQSQLFLDFDTKQREDSDHWTFYRRRIPYLMFHTGDHEDYHRPSDDVDKLNYDGLTRLSGLLFDLLRQAGAIQPLSGFRDEVVREHRAPDGNRPPPVSRLGIRWSPSIDSGGSFLITGVTAGSPAAQAGLRPGDRIVRFNGATAAEISDLIRDVLASPAEVTLEIARQGEPSTVKIPVKLRGGPIRLGVQWRTDSAEPNSVIVAGIVPGSPAAAELRVSDRLHLLDADGRPAADWLRAVSTSPELSVRLLRERNGRVREVAIDLLPAPVVSTPKSR